MIPVIKPQSHRITTRRLNLEISDLREVSKSLDLSLNALLYLYIDSNRLEITLNQVLGMRRFPRRRLKQFLLPLPSSLFFGLRFRSLQGGKYIRTDWEYIPSIHAFLNILQGYPGSPSLNSQNGEPKLFPSVTTYPEPPRRFVELPFLQWVSLNKTINDIAHLLAHFVLLIGNRTSTYHQRPSFRVPTSSCPLQSPQHCFRHHPSITTPI